MEAVQREDRQQNEDEVVGGEKRDVGRRHRWILVATLILLCTAELLAPFAAESYGFTGFVGVALIAMALWIAVFRSRSALALGPLLAFAIALRVALLFSSPALSGDVYRYVWDGDVAVHGINPYRYAPLDPALEQLRTKDFSKINHPEIPTIYPPYAQLLFSVASLLHAGINGWRILLVIGDLLFVALLFRRVSPRIALSWGVSPLVAFEGAWNGHVDLVAAILVAVAVLVSLDRVRTSAFLLAFATGIKIAPIAALPPLVAASKRRIAYAAAYFVSLATPLVPFAIAGALMRGFTEYAHQWEFNAPLFTGIRWALELLGVPDRLKSFWTSVKDPLHAERISNFVYHHLDANFLARAVCGATAIVAIAFITRSAMSLERKCAWCIGALLLAAPTVHPWYWLPVLALALPANDLLLIAFAHYSVASYLLYRGTPQSVVFAIAYGIPLVIAIFVTIRRAGGSSPARASARAS